MGLHIDRYSHSYSTLHILRQFALDVEKNEKKLMCYDYGEIKDCGKCFYCTGKSEDTKYPEFILFNDCKGYYISEKNIGKIEKSIHAKETLSVGNLDKLKEEVEDLNKHAEVLLEDGVLSAWNDFYNDVMEEDYVLEYK